jgi:protein-S-isoprenylcysteine O-methyltransferase Ste14
MTQENNKISTVKMTFTIIYILCFPALILFLSGDWRWLEGWIFSIWFAAVCLTSITYLVRNDPALLAERYKQPGTANQQGWDKYVVGGLFLGFMVWLIIMPLDAKRYGWTTSFPPELKVFGGALLLCSFFFLYRSYTDNTFASPLVRIQSERKQQVVTTGVYSFVRHPMYLGGVLLFMGTPLLLGSIYGVIAGGLLSLLIMGRIIGEERMLAQELGGYADYQKKVKYRLIPFVW